MEGAKLARNSSGCNSSSSMSSQSEEDIMMMNMELRRGPWTVEEDLTLVNYIANHGEGRWNSLARCAGLKRTGKSCRLRWLNYLRPDVRRGNITLEEQLLILELHSRWGNRWSKIAQHLPGRTDNEIKNYWRTRVQKHAKQLKCDVNSKQFKDTMRYLWMPRLVERIQANNNNDNNNNNLVSFNQSGTGSGQPLQFPSNNNSVDFGGYTPDNSSTAASSDSFGAQVSPLSDFTEQYNYSSATASNNNPVPIISQNPNQDQYGCFQSYHHQSTPLTRGSNVNDDHQSFGINQGGLMDFQGIDHHHNHHQTNWNMDGLDQSEMGLWNNVDDFWFLQQQLNNSI